MWKASTFILSIIKHQKQAPHIYEIPVRLVTTVITIKIEEFTHLLVSFNVLIESYFD